MDDYIDRIDRDPRYQSIRRASWQQWRRLREDKHFVLETSRLKLHLTLAYGRQSEDIRSFFKPQFHPTVSRAKQLRARIKKLSDKELRKVLLRYIGYVFRFGVIMELAEKVPHFRTVGLPPETANKFRVTLRKGGFLPWGNFRWDGETPVADLFGDEKLAVGIRLQQFINSGAGKYVEIEDKQQRSVLRQLLDFACEPDKLTFVLVRGDRPCLMALIGEDISIDHVWHRAGTVVSELQKEHHGRVRAGRPPAWRTLHRHLNVLLRSGSNLNNAILLAKTSQASEVYSTFSALSQLKRKLEL
jgi:hypothetical protein